MVEPVSIVKLFDNDFVVCVRRELVTTNARTGRFEKTFRRFTFWNVT